jgi:tripartite-type tricarboxylate transporter receptor subunit TctC
MYVIVALAFAIFATFKLISISEATTHDFYKDKTMTLIAGSAPGSGVDILARSVAHVLDRYLGTRRTIVQNMPGAAGVVMTNYVSNLAKPDGLHLGTHIAASQTLYQATDAGAAAKYDVRKLSWVGVVQPLQDVLIVNGRKYKSVADLKAEKKPIRFGLTGKGGMGHLAGVTLSKLLGIEFNYVSGYSGGALPTAIERGELDVIAGSVLPFVDGIRAGRFVPLMVVSRFRDPAVPDVPTVREALGTIPSPLDVWIDLSLAGRFFVGPPRIPQDRLEFLRQAFANVSESPEFKELAQKQGILIRFIPGEEAKKIAADFLAMPEHLEDLKKRFQE